MEDTRKMRSLVLVEGIIFVLLGLVALGSPMMVTLSLNYLLGGLLVIGGIAQGVRAFSSTSAPGFGVTLAAALVSVIAGGLLISHPWVGVLTLTLLLALFFFFEGISKVVYAIEYRRTTPWGWILLSGLISLLLAGFIIGGWPYTGAWVLGVYLGIYLLVVGFSLIFFSCGLKKG